MLLNSDFGHPTYFIVRADGSHVTLEDVAFQELLSLEMCFCSPSCPSLVIFPVFNTPQGKTPSRIARESWEQSGMEVGSVDDAAVREFDDWITFLKTTDGMSPITYAEFLNTHPGFELCGAKFDWDDKVSKLTKMKSQFPELAEVIEKQLKINALLETPEMKAMAGRWYGHGHWAAPYWFIGPEAGMDKEGGDTLQKRHRVWQEMDEGEVLDCIEYHKKLGITKFHEGAHPPTQPTWRKLIRVLLTYKRGLAPSLEDIRQYQKSHWATQNGESCVIELSGIPAPSTRTEQDRTQFQNQRIEVIRKRISEHRDEIEFVLLYGKLRKKQWEKIAGGEFTMTTLGARDSEAGFRRDGSLLIVYTLSPTTTGLGKDYWEELGFLIRELLSVR